MEKRIKKLVNIDTISRFMTIEEREVVTVNVLGK